MNQNLIKAKFAVAITSGMTTNVESVLAEILAIEEIRKPNTPAALSDIIPSKLNMSTTMYRKVIHELYKNDLLTKKDGLVSVNRKYIVI